MIQRIQSLYLLLASVAGFGQFGLPYLRAEAGSPATAQPVFADLSLTPTDNPGLIGLCILVGIVSLAAVFLFKNRQLQARITTGALLCSVLLAVLLAFTVQQLTAQGQPNSGIQYQAGLALPAVSALFQWLAGKAIRKDEALVRSMDRLR
jgi:hypothetical protein